MIGGLVFGCFGFVVDGFDWFKLLVWDCGFVGLLGVCRLVSCLVLDALFADLVIGLIGLYGTLDWLG